MEQESARIYPTVSAAVDAFRKNAKAAAKQTKKAAGERQTETSPGKSETEH